MKYEVYDDRKNVSYRVEGAEELTDAIMRCGGHWRIEAYVDTDIQVLVLLQKVEQSLAVKNLSNDDVVGEIIADVQKAIALLLPF